MEAIEFETRLKLGVTQLPLAYRHWHEGEKVKVIVLAADRDSAGDNDIEQDLVLTDIEGRTEK